MYKKSDKKQINAEKIDIIIYFLVQTITGNCIKP